MAIRTIGRVSIVKHNGINVPRMELKGFPRHIRQIAHSIQKVPNKKIVWHLSSTLHYIRCAKLISHGDGSC